MLATLRGAALGVVASASHALSATPRYVAPDAPIEQYAVARDQLARAGDLLHAAHVSYVTRSLWGLVVVVIVLRLGIATRLVRWAQQRTARVWLQTAVATFLIMTVVAVPSAAVDLILWGTAATASAFGHAAVTIGLGTIVASVVYTVVRAYPRRWWCAALVAAPLVAIAPIAGSELDCSGAPRLEDRAPELVDRIETLAERRGISLARERIFVMPDGSPDARAVGIGPWHAIFINEGAMLELDDRELTFLLAHELGHFYDPSLELVAVAGAALAAALALAGLLAVIAVIVRRRGARWGIPELANPSSLPVALLAIAISGLVMAPVRALVQRRIERAADLHGLQIIDGLYPDARQVAAHELQRIGEVFGMPPENGVLDVLCGFDHPAIGDRISFVLSAPLE